MHSTLQWVLLSLALGQVNGIELDITSTQSLIDASGTIAYDMMESYSGNQTGGVPGNLPEPYYWWETGAMFMHMVDYYYCGSRT